MEEDSDSTGSWSRGVPRPEGGVKYNRTAFGVEVQIELMDGTRQTIGLLGSRASEHDINECFYSWYPKLRPGSRTRMDSEQEADMDAEGTRGDRKALHSNFLRILEMHTQSLELIRTEQVNIRAEVQSMRESLFTLQEVQDIYDQRLRTIMFCIAPGLFETNGGDPVVGASASAENAPVFRSDMDFQRMRTLIENIAARQERLTSAYHGLDEQVRVMWHDIWLNAPVGVVDQEEDLVFGGDQDYDVFARDMALGNLLPIRSYAAQTLERTQRSNPNDIPPNHQDELFRWHPVYGDRLGTCNVSYRTIASPVALHANARVEHLILARSAQAARVDPALLFERLVDPDDPNRHYLARRPESREFERAPTDGGPTSTVPTRQALHRSNFHGEREINRRSHNLNVDRAEHDTMPPGLTARQQIMEPAIRLVRRQNLGNQQRREDRFLAFERAVLARRDGIIAGEEATLNQLQEQQTAHQQSQR